jgi:putative ABC transport system substrate-binding protein
VRRRVFLVYAPCLAGIGRHAQAQNVGDLPRIAILSPDPAAIGTNRLAAFLATLREFGYVDGRNIRLDIRFAENRLDRLPALAAELVKARPTVIYTYTTGGPSLLPEQQPAFRSS